MCNAVVPLEVSNIEKFELTIFTYLTLKNVRYEPTDETHPVSIQSLIVFIFITTQIWTKSSNIIIYS